MNQTYFVDDVGDYFRIPDYLRGDINKVAPLDTLPRPYTRTVNRNALRLSRAQVVDLDDKMYEERTYGRDPRAMDNTVNSILAKRNTVYGPPLRSTTPDPRSMLQTAGTQLFDNRINNVRSRIEAEITG